MKQALLQQLVQADNEIGNIELKIKENKKQYEAQVSALVPQIKSCKLKIQQVSKENLPKPAGLEFQNENFQILYNLQHTLQFVESVSDSNQLLSTIQSLLKQNKFRDALKSFIHIQQLDELLNQRCVDIHGESLNILKQYSESYCIQQSDFFIKAKSDEYLMKLMINQEERKIFSSFFTQFRNSIQHISMLSSDYVKQLSVFVQTSLSHLNMLFETLFKYSSDVLTFQLADAFGVSLSQFENEAIQGFMRDILDFLNGFINKYIESAEQGVKEEPDFQNTFTNSLQVSVSLLHRYQQMVVALIDKFNVNIEQIKVNLNCQKFNNNQFQLIEQTDCKQLITRVCDSYVSSEKAYFKQQMDKLIQQKNVGNEYFQLIKHIMLRIDSTDISEQFMNKVTLKRDFVSIMCDHFKANLQIIEDPMTIYQIYSKISSMHLYYDETDNIFVAFQAKLEQILSNNIKIFGKQQLYGFVNKLVLTTNADSMIEYFQQLISQQDQIDIVEQQINFYLNSPFIDKSCIIIVKQLEQLFIQNIITSKRPISTTDLVNLNKQLQKLQQFFTDLLHRSCIQEFKCMRAVIYVMGSGKKVEALEVGIELGDEIVTQLCNVQGIM